MSDTEIAIFCGKLLSAWVAGFCAGYILTRFREALNHVA